MGTRAGGGSVTDRATLLDLLLADPAKATDVSAAKSTV
jgi:alcohol dehydrogenase class IV